jgi:lipoprotein-anchoring transpeptidase ErfK/SrfK
MSSLNSSTAAEPASSAPQSESSKAVSSINSNIPSSKQSASSKIPVISSENAPSLNTAMDQKAQQFTSNTRYLILVDLQSQTVGIYNGSKEHWMLVHSYMCSSGSGGEDATPTGTFTIQGRGTWSFNQTVQEGAEWWTQFSGDFLFHSLPMNQNHEVIDPTLGVPASHGCIRLAIENAKWIYDNIPRGTKVYIY